MTKIQNNIGLSKNKYVSQHVFSPSSVLNLSPSVLPQKNSEISFVDFESGVSPVFGCVHHLTDTQQDVSKKANYLDSYDKSCTDRNSVDSFVSIFKIKDTEKAKIPGCCSGFLSFVCPCCGKKYFRALLCGKEWCPDCGQDNSWLHKRHMARWWDKVMQIKVLGYLVVTTSLQMRNYLQSLDVKAHQMVLNEVRNYWVRKLKRELNTRGMVRWHWAGDDGSRYAPHLNFLIDFGHISQKTLTLWRLQFSDWLFKTYGVKTKVVINYRYCSRKQDKIHILKYVTRSTMRKCPSVYLQSVFHNYRNNVMFGRFDKEFHDSDFSRVLADLEACKCPDCKSVLVFDCYVNYVDFCLYERKHLVAGWFVDSS